jgi:inosine-uridine nucleoside N-ribohydrolase
MPGSRPWSLIDLRGGCSEPGTYKLNFALDRRAAATVLACEVPVRLVPMEPCRAVWAGEAELRQLPVWLAEGCGAWLATSWMRHPLGLLTGRRCFHPWDVLAAVAALGDEGVFTWVRRGVRLDERPLRSGYVRYGEGSVEVAVQVDPEALLGAWLG